MPKKINRAPANAVHAAESARLRCLEAATTHEVCPYAARGLPCRNARPGEACGCYRQRPSAGLDDVLREAVEGLDGLHSNLRCFPDEFTPVRVCNSLARYRNSIATELGLPSLALVAPCDVAGDLRVDTSELRDLLGLLSAAERCLRNDQVRAVRIALTEGVDRLLRLLGPAVCNPNLPHEAIEEQEQRGYCRCGEPLAAPVHAYRERIEAQTDRIDANLNARSRKARKKR